MLSFTTNGNFIDFKYTEDQYPFYVHQLTRLHNTSKCITWGYSDDTTRISFTIDDETYDNIPITSIYFDGVVMSAQADFKTNIESMFPGLAGGTGASSYLVYTALLSQASTDAPTATVLENTLGGTVVWTRNGVGDYVGTLAGAFTLDKTFINGMDITQTAVYVSIAGSTLSEAGYSVSRLSADAIGVVSSLNDYTPVDLSTYLIGKLAIEIRVYP